MLSKADFAHAVLKIFCAAENFYFHTDEINRQIAPINFWKTHGIFLRRNDRICLLLFAAIDDVQNLLLRETMVIGEFSGVNQISAETDKALFKAFRLRDAAERRNFAAFKIIGAEALGSEEVFEIERVVNAFDDAGLGIIFLNDLSQLSGIAVAFRDKNGVSASKVGRRFAQGAAGKKIFVSERLLAINEDDVLPAAAQFPILKSIVQQQGVAAEFFDSIAPAFHAVFVHEHDHILEVGGEHVRFVAGHFRIEQKRFAIRDDARRSCVVPKEDLVD